MKEIKDDTERWRDTPYSWTEIINIVHEERSTLISFIFILLSRPRFGAINQEGGPNYPHLLTYCIGSILWEKKMNKISRQVKTCLYGSRIHLFCIFFFLFKDSVKYHLSISKKWAWGTEAGGQGRDAHQRVKILSCKMSKFQGPNVQHGYYS